MNEDGEIEIDLDFIDLFDVMIDGVFDFGVMICEELVFNLDFFLCKFGVFFVGGDFEFEFVEDDDV